MSKTIFITGASSGLGKATAKLFQSKGWKVIATMRNPEKETELNLLSNVTLIPLDVTNLEQIKTTVAQVTLEGVDVVFNNAGYGLVGPIEAISDEKLIRQINTNVLGVIRVTQAFIPYFKSKKSGLFITTTSIGGHVAFPLGSVYHATKWALEGFNESLSYELKLFGIGVKTVVPGAILTEFFGRSFDNVSHPDYDELNQRIGASFDPSTFSSAEHIAETVFEAATDDKDLLRYVAGADAIATYEARKQMGDIEFIKSIVANFQIT